ncbi:DUF4349 domain-containing protein [Hymenobacter sp. M29]|uniref:DUF4349 domain-containing protein n=1 Tax=Hymenobacter mellowenesis TaxID=3063995 RepID=A0ABT9ABZ0_9BACT|nr:DUF4349 domain-containing protein [Hymenobacter sp. M29]MDO7847364.1 DUF4349 domain-containing protein [Hymenobacter sp. M29]
MKYHLGFALGLAVLLGGCSHAHKEEADEAVADAPLREMNAPAMLIAPSAPSQNQNDDREATATVLPGPRPYTESIVAPSRLLIYHADLRLKVTNLPRASASLDSLVHRNGGYLSASTEVRADGEWRQAMTIRVAPARFQPLMAALGGVGTVEEKKLTTDDVTAQHADVAARLTTKRAVEKRYIDLLARAKKISEVLEIEGKIGEVREEIESTESRLKTLNDEVAYSTISLTCYQPLPQTVPEAPVVSFASRAAESFYLGWTIITSLVIGLVALWPFLLLTSIIWWAVRALAAAQPGAGLAEVLQKRASRIRGRPFSIADIQA